MPPEKFNICTSSVEKTENKVRFVGGLKSLVANLIVGIFSTLMHSCLLSPSSYITTHMQLTPEQEAIINSTGDIKINAVAGSGKTTTVIEYAKARPRSSRILYLAFNRSVKTEAKKKFEESGLHNVNVETAHSLAFKYIVPYSGYKVRAQGYKTHEVAEVLALQATGEKHAEYIVANHINKFVTYFCNSDKTKLHDLNYLDVVMDAKARIFVNTFYEYIKAQARLFLKKMDDGDIEVIHDFYLKKFQLSRPVLPYDYILFDEGQDASAAMLDVFVNQPAVKVIVGDTHQQIYGWRYAVNSLEKVSFTKYLLSTSFRFGQPVADLSKQVLGLKNDIVPQDPVSIIGAGNGNGKTTKAVLARTNLGLLLKSIEYVQEKPNLKKIYFEGNINSYTYADDGASLYDVLHLYNKKNSLVRDKLIKSMGNMAELEEYIEKTEDVQLGMMVEIVKEYGNRIPAIIKSIKDRHVENDEKDKAEIIFSTVHRSKGMEYDAVHLVDDFINEERLKKKLDEKEGVADTAKLIEEINLLYVAVTRTKNLLYIPEGLLPNAFVPSANIRIIKAKEKEPERAASYYEYEHYDGAKARQAKSAKQQSSLHKHEVVKKPKEKPRPWTRTEDLELQQMFEERVDVYGIARHFKRTPGSIKSRIRKMQLKDPFD